MTTPIVFNGDAVRLHVPLLEQFKVDLLGTVGPLGEVAACHWADGVPDGDTQSLQARDYVKQMFDQYIMPAYGQLGEAIGVQGDKLGLVGQIGDHTESSNAEVASGWDGDHKA
jgi:hypothetical protein